MLKIYKVEAAIFGYVTWHPTTLARWWHTDAALYSVRTDFSCLAWPRWWRIGAVLPIPTARAKFKSRATWPCWWRIGAARLALAKSLRLCRKLSPLQTARNLEKDIVMNIFLEHIGCFELEWWSGDDRVNGQWSRSCFCKNLTLCYKSSFFKSLILHFYFCLQNESEANIQGKDSPQSIITQSNINTAKSTEVLNQTSQFQKAVSTSASKIQSYCESFFYIQAGPPHKRWRQECVNVNNVQTYITICEHCEQVDPYITICRHCEQCGNINYNM